MEHLNQHETAQDLNISIFEGNEKLSIFSNAMTSISNETISLEEAFESIRDGFVERQIKDLRVLVENGDRPGYDSLKKQLPAITFSGLFKKRGKDHLEQHSGLICLDFDHLPNAGEVKRQLIEDPYARLIFISPSGQGLKVVVKIEGEHDKLFEMLANHYQQTYGLKADQSGKDVSRLCFLSHDPEAHYNPESWSFDPKFMKDFDPQQHEMGQRADEALAMDQVRELLQWIPPRPDYGQWIKIISAVGASLPDADAEMVLSEWSPEEKQGEYLEKLQKGRLDKCNPRTLIWHAKQNGF
ncbi:MAG: hypothetical protein HQM12_19775, partial [SAR324 cluster bacterium]|nr:hypothetical protein [SAR324 cluster bacterium]